MTLNAQGWLLAHMSFDDSQRFQFSTFSNGVIMKNKLLVSVGLSLILVGMPFASALHAETLQDSVRSAIKSHPTVERAKIGRSIAHEGVTEKRSDYFPEVSANIGGGRLYGDNSTSRGLSVTRGSGYSWLWEGTASVNQMVYDWNMTTDRVRSARAQEAASLHSLDDTMQSIAYQTVQAHIEYHRAKTLFADAQKNLADMKSYQARIKKMVEGGGADEGEASRARDLVLMAQNRLTDLKGQVKASEASYIEAVGSKPTGELQKPIMPFAMDTDTALEDLIAKIQSHHPQVRALVETGNALEYDEAAESKSALPMLNSEMSYSKKDQRDVIGGESTDARAMLRLSWTLETGGGQFARQRRSSLQKEEAMAQLDELRRALEKNLRIAMAGLEVAQEQYDTQKGRYDEAVSTLSTYKKQFEASKKTLLEVMQADSQAFDAKVGYLSAEYGVLDAAYGFLASQGSITDAIDILATIHDAPPVKSVVVPVAMNASVAESVAVAQTVKEEPKAQDVAKKAEPVVASAKPARGMEPIVEVAAQEGTYTQPEEVASATQIAATEPASKPDDLRIAPQDHGVKDSVKNGAQEGIKQAAIHDVNADVAAAEALEKQLKQDVAEKRQAQMAAESKTAANPEPETVTVVAAESEVVAAEPVVEVVSEPYAEKNVDFVAFKLQKTLKAEPKSPMDAQAAK